MNEGQLQEEKTLRIASGKSKPEYLTVDEARMELQSIGISCTERQMRRWAEQRVLPFFPWGKRLYIDRAELLATVKSRQLAALGPSRRLRH